MASTAKGYNDAPLRSGSLARELARWMMAHTYVRTAQRGIDFVGLCLCSNAAYLYCVTTRSRI